MFIFLEGAPGVPEVITSLFPNLPNFIAHVLSTIVIIILLSKLVYKPFRKTIENRREKINELLDDAALKQTLANKNRNDAMLMLKEAKTESQVIINGARNEADHTKMEILENARAEAGNIQNHAKTAIERERHEVQEQIRQNIVDLAFEAAGKVLEINVSKEQNQKLVNEFLDSLDK